MTARLVDYIRAHDHEAYAHGPHQILVVNGRLDLEIIPATLAAVRAWLKEH